MSSLELTDQERYPAQHIDHWQLAGEVATFMMQASDEAWKNYYGIDDSDYYRHKVAALAIIEGVLTGSEGLDLSDDRYSGLNGMCEAFVDIGWALSPRNHAADRVAMRGFYGDCLGMWEQVLSRCHLPTISIEDLQGTITGTQRELLHAGKHTSVRMQDVVSVIDVSQLHAAPHMLRFIGCSTLALSDKL